MVIKIQRAPDRDSRFFVDAVLAWSVGGCVCCPGVFGDSDLLALCFIGLNYGAFVSTVD
jgi:hypothetical protein